ncbi:putative Zn finger-like uncharacterized protein [Geothermobacter ehrlichii]|uniref:Putative Zn finger-like uncharacterized protein n=1 Tax=Geothermobacter ehrlichii TaxID=213224 RepID=A0A5D3WI02_9BACT|nr:RDD family protein [Geothermobacter ehrlichii]TYO97486.1 putative Zn finger-like uncharacterized protein [Geothermobacter ehrlichii]
MTITCPHCRYRRDVPAERIPPRTVRVLCPRCGQRFAWTPPDRQPAPAAAETSTAKPSPIRSEPGEQTQATPAAARTETAGFGLRLVAHLLDCVAFSLLVLVLAFGLSLIIHLFGGSHPRALELMGLLALFVLLTAHWLFAVVFIGYCGQTPGKMVTRIRVERADGSEVGYAAAFLREVVAKPISALVLFCGYLMILFDPQHRGLHDKIAGTRVVKL